MTVQRDRFLLDVGIRDGEEASDEAKALLRANFVSFLRAGGSFSWSDWATMSSPTCEIAEDAGLEVTRERIAAQAQYIAAALGVPQEAPAAPPAPPPPAEDAGADEIRAALERAAGAAG